MEEVEEGRYSRVNALASTYWTLCRTNALVHLRDRARSFQQPSGSFERAELGRSSDDAGLIAIVFGAMCVEAGAFDYAAIHLGDKYTRQNLDKLDLVSKWTIVTRLVTGKILRSDGKALQYLRALVRARNQLVHVKSVPLVFDELTPSFFQRHEKEFCEAVEMSCRAVYCLAAEIRLLHGRSPSPLWWVKLDDPRSFDDMDQDPRMAGFRLEATQYRDQCAVDGSPEVASGQPRL